MHVLDESLSETPEKRPPKHGQWRKWVMSFLEHTAASLGLWSLAKPSRHLSTAHFLPALPSSNHSLGRGS